MYLKKKSNVLDVLPQGLVCQKKKPENINVKKKEKTRWKNVIREENILNIA